MIVRVKEIPAKMVVFVWTENIMLNVSALVDFMEIHVKVI